jgi:integration host factor subunit beta
MVARPGRLVACDGRAAGPGDAMTKSDLIKHVAEAKQLSRGRAEALVNRVFDSVVEALRRGERVEIRGIGSFEIRKYGAYTGRNPRTGVTVAVKPKRLAFFKVGKGLKDLINASVTRTQDMPAVDAGTPVPAARTAARGA